MAGKFELMKFENIPLVELRRIKVIQFRWNERSGYKFFCSGDYKKFESITSKRFGTIRRYFDMKNGVLNGK